MSGLFLGVDTSNYTTSLALCDENNTILKSVRRLLPVPNGSAGLRQNDAVFLHTKALPSLASELFSDSDYSPEHLLAVGVSSKPCSAQGSYMPCFLSGISFASAISSALGIPLYSFTHQAGHIMAGIYSCAKPELFDKAFLSFHVSGGTTDALYVRRNLWEIECEHVGGTNDANAGQIIDRAGLLLELPFPCGTHLEKIASFSNKKIKETVSVKDSYFSLSGLQNKFEQHLQNGENRENAARFLFESIAKALFVSTEALREKHGANLPVLFAGGVICNSFIRQTLSKMQDVFFASKELSSDNAVGICLLCMQRYIKEKSE